MAGRMLKSKKSDGAVPVEFDAVEAAQDNIRRINERRDALKTLEGLGMPSYDYGTKIEVHLRNLDVELSVDVSDASADEIIPRVLAQLYEVAFEAGRAAERETQADALMTAVPALASRIRKIADEAISDARWAERNDRDSY
ncbi:hypothetical protein [Rhizobium leguminosarum]|uniref:hypothetical protein n=1 Tax=Rhizobium leguminosarum TaxID=384 RepID=UPI002E0E748A|nr:hypothetical protein U8Q02_42120 [Rhizobium leguminosarum]